MRRGCSSSRVLLLAGIVLVACSLQHAAAAAAAGSRGRNLQQTETATKTTMGVKKPKPLAPNEIMAVAAATGALLPACVPKYVTDLVIPPPMPVTTQPLTEVVARHRGRETAGRTLLDADASAPAAAILPAATTDVKKASKTATVSTAAGADLRVPIRAGWSEDEGRSPRSRYSREFDEDTYARDMDAEEEEEEERPAKSRREVYDIDDDYWGAIYNEKKPKSSSSKKKSKKVEQEAPLPSPSPAPVLTPSASPIPAVQSSPAPAPLPEATPEPPASQSMPPYTGYDISARQIVQDVLPQAPTSPHALPGCPAFFKQTELLAYGPANVPGTPFHNWPAYTIEAQHTSETRVRWTNDLVDSSGNFMPHLLKEAIDQTLTWANPSALGGETDASPCHTCKKMEPGACQKDTFCMIAASTTYNGPVPLVTHLHGQNNVNDYSDGYPEAWYLPKAKNLLAYKNVGGWYQTFKREYSAATGNRWNQGSFTAIYKNLNRPGTQWFHDNTLGMTRLNVYAGLSGFYFVRERFPSLANGPELPGLPYPAYDGTIDPILVRELPLAIQDRAFTNESQLWYPVADHTANNNLPAGPVPPRSLPEFSATVTANGVPVNMVMMTVNGRTYPRQIVHPDAYRLRILNSGNTRTLQLRFARSSKAAINPLSSLDLATLLPFYVVGNEGGFFPQLQPPMTTLQMGPGERYDVVVDFTSMNPGEFVYMLNNGPEPDTALYDGANNGVGLTEHTAQIMRFDVTELPFDLKARPFTADEQCALNQALKLHWQKTAKPIEAAAGQRARRLTLLDRTTADGTPVLMQMGTAGANTATATAWSESVATSAAANSTQFWDIINLTPDAVPIHVHTTDIRFIGRWRVEIDPTNPHAFEDTDVRITNNDLDPLLQVHCSVETSGKCAVPRDSMLILPGTRTRIALNTPPLQGLFAWNSNMLEAQDNEMIAPYCVGNPTYIDPRRPGQRMCPGSK